MTIPRHDFTKPVRLPAEQQNRLIAWCRAALAQANRAWAKQLPTPIEASLGELDMERAKDALTRLPDGMVGYRVTSADGKLPMYLVLPRSLLLKLVGVMLGDAGGEPEERDLTLIEENLADHFLVSLWLPFFRETWPGARQASWQLQPREAHPQASRAFAPTDELTTLAWKIKGAWGESTGHWFFQKKGLLESLTEGGKAPAPPPDDKTLAARKETLVVNMPVVLELVLGTAELKLSQLSGLQVGDVVLLDQRDQGGIIARAGGLDLFRGRAGRTGSWKAFQIQSVVEK